MNEMEPMDELDAAIDARLKAAFAPPGDVRRMARDVLAKSGAVRPVSRWRHLRAAAAILIGVLGLAWLASRDGGPPPEPSAMDAGQLHAHVAAELGEPMSCASPEEANRIVTQLVTESAGVELDYQGGTRVPLQGPFALPEGWSGDPGAAVLAGHFEGRVVVVVIEGAQACGSGIEPADDLRVHRRELGDYVLYELSGGDAPVCLDGFSL